MADTALTQEDLDKAIALLNDAKYYLDAGADFKAGHWAATAARLIQDKIS